MKLQKTTTMAIALVVTGLFAYSEVAKKEHEIHHKQNKYDAMVKAVRN
jgi:hypothetical protein